MSRRIPGWTWGALRLLTWSWLAVTVGAVAWLLRQPTLAAGEDEEPHRPPAVLHDTIGPELSPATADSLRELVLARAPFRAARVPARVRYDPAHTLPPGSEPPPPRPAPPSLNLLGVVWGSTPAAVLEGVPGVDGARVMQRGDSAGGVRLLGIAADRVTVRWSDTTWTLRLRDRWP